MKPLTAKQRKAMQALTEETVVDIPTDCDTTLSLNLVKQLQKLNSKITKVNT